MAVHHSTAIGRRRRRRSPSPYCIAAICPDSFTATTALIPFILAASNLPSPAASICCRRPPPAYIMTTHEDTVSEPFRIRRLRLSDKGKGFIDLLKQLTACDLISDEDFTTRFHELSSLGDDHVIVVIEDGCSGQIVGTGSVFVERKFIRNCGKVGHIEDIVVDYNFRGMRLGQKIIQFLSEHARSVGCYKVILDCDEEKMEFYEKCGFQKKGLQMASYFN